MSVTVPLLTRVGPGFRFLRGLCDAGLDMMEKENVFISEKECGNCEWLRTDELGGDGVHQNGIPYSARVLDPQTSTTRQPRDWQ